MAVTRLLLRHTECAYYIDSHSETAVVALTTAACVRRVAQSRHREPPLLFRPISAGIEQYVLALQPGFLLDGLAGRVYPCRGQLKQNVDLGEADFPHAFGRALALDVRRSRFGIRP